MKKILGVMAIFALAACSVEGEEAEAPADDSEAPVELTGDAPGFEAVAPGTYQVTRAGGEVDFIEIHPGMTFSRVAQGGEATGGVIFMKNGMSCFLVEGEEEEACFTDGPTKEDGSMETTSEAGDVSVVMPVEGSLADHVSMDEAAVEAPAEE